MILYLVQHGEAKTEAEDPARPLSDRGREEVLRVAQKAVRLEVRPRRIFHSGKLRAQQTAELLVQVLAPTEGIHAVQHLAPNDPVAPWAERLATESEDLLLVGHLPHLGYLAGLLLCGDATKVPVRFRMGGMVCLQRGDGAWTLLWTLLPEYA